ncbi:hypothetical protein [Wenyingzhuangia aestuarii]|uniref:hypothetical protein n=1 Tax=Wenyingzhuangia aestuarii TaxID=1647582 RepID=UPI001FD78A92|nr:hypothetical protein [Wenyingzhuangia aestuarii]NJB84231.1 hypothetical protein [Wenyingzhuangia aestuarii]
MRTVTKQESDNARHNLINWSKKGEISSQGQLGEWIFNQEDIKPESIPETNYMMSKTPNAAQLIIFYNDKPNEYPSTPKSIEGNPLSAYYNNLKKGVPFFKNHNGKYVILKSGFSKDEQSIYVMSRADYVWRKQSNEEYIPVPINELKENISIKDLPHTLTEITYIDNFYLHSEVESGFHPIEELEQIFQDYTK